MEANQGKNLIIELADPSAGSGLKKWARYPVKTHFITPGENLEGIIKEHVLPFSKEGDIVALGQKIVSIAQKRIIYKKDLKIGFWAKFLSKFVKKTSFGFSVGNPLKMQVAINIAGLPRVIFSAVLGFVAKGLGIKGLFYILAGNQISQIDGFYEEAFKQYAEMGILGPVDCDNLCNDLNKKFNLPFCVVDVNDIGLNILGSSPEVDQKLVARALKDNPSGQSDQQTPIIIIREVK